MKKETIIKNNVEQRNWFFEMRAEEEDGIGTLEGYPIVFEKSTDICGCFEEKISKEALKKTDMRDIPLLTNHDLNQLPVARSRRNNENSTMQLTTDDKGLKMIAKLDLKNNPRSQELFSAVKRGDVDGMSFMFTVDSESWTDEESDYPKRLIESIGKVWEVSAVTFPAYKDTSIGARSSMDIEEAKLLLEKRRKISGQKNTDETNLREKLLKQIEIESL